MKYQHSLYSADQSVIGPAGGQRLVVCWGVKPKYGLREVIAETFGTTYVLRITNTHLENPRKSKWEAFTADLEISLDQRTR